MVVQIACHAVSGVCVRTMRSPCILYISSPADVACIVASSSGTSPSFSLTKMVSLSPDTRRTSNLMYARSLLNDTLCVGAVN